MQDIRNYFTNPFDSPRISDNNLDNFAQDHVGRLRGHSSTGVYEAILAATAPLSKAFGKAISDEDISSGVKKGCTLAANKQMRLFKKTTSRHEGAVQSAFGEDSAEYLEFFPNGLSEYTKLKQSNAEKLMHRIKEATARYTAELGAGIAAEFADLLATYKVLRSKQQSAFGTVENRRTATATARKALVAQLYVNLLFIASQNVGYPDRADDFMEQGLILKKGRGKK